MRRRLIVYSIVFAVAHLVVLTGVFFVGFAIGMDRFDRGGEPGIWEKLISAALNFAFVILTFPAILIYWLSPVHLPALVQTALVVFNSCCWGIGIASLFLRFQSRAPAK